jgi:hypothetical protein
LLWFAEEAVTMTNEHHTAKKRKPAGPGSLSSGAGYEMTPDERLDFEERVVHGDEPGLPAEDPDRLTKSGRLNLEQVKDAIAESDEDDKNA